MRIVTEMKPYVENPLSEWQAASKLHFDLVTDPEVHWRKLVDLAMLAHERVRCAVMSYRKC